MNMIERVVIYCLLLVALVFAFKKPSPVVLPPVAPVAPVPARPPEKSPPAPSEKFSDGFRRNSSGEIVEISPISVMNGEGGSRYWVEGVQVSIGSVTSRGRVEYVDKDKIVFKDFDGKSRHVINGSRPSEKASAAPASARNG